MSVAILAQAFWALGLVSAVPLNTKQYVEVTLSASP